MSFFSSARPPLPPGPKGLPLIGVRPLKFWNLVARLTSHTERFGHAQRERMAHIRRVGSTVWYIPSKARSISLKILTLDFVGGLCSVTLMGQPMIIVNSGEIMEQLDKRGSLHSDRPRLQMAGELVGYSKTLVLVPYGQRLRNYRRHVSRMIGSPGTLSQFHPMIEAETHMFLKRTAANPDSDLLSHNLRKCVIRFIFFCLFMFFRTSGSIILKLSYGIEVQEENDPFVSLIERANDNFSLATKPGR